MLLSFAPMEGVTNAEYRRVHRRFFPEADRYYAPFIAPDAGGRFKRSHLNALLPEANEGVRLVPQILANNAEAFLGAAETLAELGYTEVNLNAGCPSGTVVSKHKGWPSRSKRAWACTARRIFPPCSRSTGAIRSRS